MAILIDYLLSLPQDVKLAFVLFVAGVAILTILVMALIWRLAFLEIPEKAFLEANPDLKLYAKLMRQVIK